ncbi:hypothetical protein CYL31_15025 [Marinomonas sp. A3A]|uniref:DUF4238 domain-containing protein n=1 Tax=Marinomonas sp. A3A TaxID=2065312 RepID=UPI001BB4369D|nr:DUF4238 domain-containing protein [Marinomonas sp. A3A]QUX92629.1 hypothetical protein CYL31_15025 [Marinomonas sp. A3A]
MFPSNTKNVASENGFYNFTLENGGKYTWEVALSELEGKASLIIEKIIDDKSLNGLSDEQRFSLALFLAVQFVRTKDVREYFKDMVLKISGEISSRFGDMHNLFSEDCIKDIVSDESLKRYTAESLSDVKETYLPHFLNKIWTLYEAPKGESFYIGDNPVSMFNFLPSHQFGGSNIGLALKGIEIYLPISSKYSIALLCPQMISDLAGKVKVARSQNSVMFDREEINKKVSETEKLLSNILSGNAHKIDPENVTHCNSLQVMYSNSYVFSSMKNFNLAIKMIKDDERYKEGGRGQVF